MDPLGPSPIGFNNKLVELRPGCLQPCRNIIEEFFSGAFHLEIRREPRNMGGVRDASNGTIQRFAAESRADDYWLSPCNAKGLQDCGHQFRQMFYHLEGRSIVNPHSLGRAALDEFRKSEVLIVRHSCLLLRGFYLFEVDKHGFRLIDAVTECLALFVQGIYVIGKAGFGHTTRPVFCAFDYLIIGAFQLGLTTEDSFALHLFLNVNFVLGHDSFILSYTG